MRKSRFFRSPVISLAFLLVIVSWGWIQGKDAKSPATLDEKASYKAWSAACQTMLENRTGLSFPAKAYLPLPDPSPLYRLADLAVKQGSTLKPWVGKNPPPPRGVTFDPFAQKLSLSANSRVVVHGDLHGDIRSLMASLADLQKRKILTGFKVTAPNTHLLFLGDYTDRGYCGVEVLYTLLRLRLENPRRVWLARGNHEDPYMTKRYGFAEEGIKKYGEEFKHKRIAALFETLPSVIYVGTSRNFLQSCHGGVEPGYDPKPLLRSRGSPSYQRLGTLTRGEFRQKHKDLFDESLDPDYRKELETTLVDFRPINPAQPQTLGFMWHDFTLYQDEPGLEMDPHSTDRLRFGHSLTQSILKLQSTPSARIRGILRAHQHSTDLTPMMERLIASKGLFRHWQEKEIASELDPPPPMESQAIRPIANGGVYTFNVSPDSRYGVGCEYNFHTYGILKLASNFANWRMEVVNLKVVH